MTQLMWNEGFHLAANPRAIVHLADRASAEALAAEINAGRFNPSGEYLYWRATVKEAHAGRPCYTLTQARAVVDEVHEWSGI